jgi:hypothetical protein
MLAPRRPAEASSAFRRIGCSQDLGSRQVTLTNGELEPEFVSYATLRRHTFCFKGMKQCEFDHDPTNSRTPPVDTRASYCNPCNATRLATNRLATKQYAYFGVHSSLDPRRLHGEMHDREHIPAHGRLHNCNEFLGRSFACSIGPSHLLVRSFVAALRTVDGFVGNHQALSFATL